MRLRARLLHVLVIAPVAALFAAGPALVAHAQTGPPLPSLVPYTVCIDPGHGGAADNSDPSLQYDPGAIGINGLMEKAATLDTGLRLRQLLQADFVNVVMTRTTDQFLSIAAREAICNAGHANLFVSIHLNYFNDPSVGGSLILYPSAGSKTFAATMEAQLGRDLKTVGIRDTGIELRDNWWIHNAMPTVTVEGAYLTNPHEAAWLATPRGRQQLAVAIKDGIEAYVPAIVAHKADVIAWMQANHAPLPSAHRVAPKSGTALPQLFEALLLMAVIARYPRPSLRVAKVLAAITVAGATMALEVINGARDVAQGRQRRRRRRRSVQQRALAARRARHARPHATYDSLWLSSQTREKKPQRV